MESLLVLLFYYRLLFHDYRGYVSRDDYQTIERALNCLYGENCLIPYPDYLKMGRLKLGDMTELAQRVKTLEDTPVLKLMKGTGDTEGSDVIIEIEE